MDETDDVMALRNKYITEIQEEREQFISIDLPHRKDQQYFIFQGVGDLVRTFLLARLYESNKKVVISVTIEREEDE